MKPNKGSNSRLHRKQLEAVGVTLPGGAASQPKTPAGGQSRHVRSPRRAPAREAKAGDSTRPEVTVRSGGEQQANVLTSTEVSVTSGPEPRTPSPGVTVTSGVTAGAVAGKPSGQKGPRP